MRRPVQIVEQTTRGIMHIREDPIVAEYASGVPVVNVAESPPKRMLEGPCIGRSVWESLHRRIGDDFRNGAHPRVLILGAGTIGRAVARALVQVAAIPPTRISVADSAVEPRAWARRMGFSVWDRHSAPERSEMSGYNLVVGCSGHPSFGPADAHVLAEDGVLASASSGDEEFAKQAFLNQAESVKRERARNGTARPSVHDDLKLVLNARPVVMMNSGFPVNFDGCINSVPPEYMQATRIAMIAAATQAVGAERAGVQPLSESFVEWIMTNCPSTSHVLAPEGHRDGGNP
jgi:S-adenosylhomocysteine hydrolase